MDSVSEYLELLTRAKQKGWPVKIGIEVDYIPEVEDEIRTFLEKYQFDYVFGSGTLDRRLRLRPERKHPSLGEKRSR